MAFTSEMFDQLRDLLNDPTDAQVPFATKKLYLNRAINLLWPRVFTQSIATIALTSGTYEYSTTTPVSTGVIISIEINTLADTNRYYRFDAYDLLPGDEDFQGRLLLADNPITGTSVRIRYATAVGPVQSASYVAAQTEAWIGPDRAMQLPVMYAMGMITARKLDDRQDTSNYNTNQALNGVDDRDIMALSQMWFAQFELELDNMAILMPPARD
jgi:hypothetical protein